MIRSNVIGLDVFSHLKLLFRFRRCSSSTAAACFRSVANPQQDASAIDSQKHVRLFKARLVENVQPMSGPACSVSE
jgi:hypothetical protein